MLKVLERLDSFKTLEEIVAKKSLPVVVTGVGEMGKALVVKYLCEKFNKKALFITTQRAKLEWERRFKNLFSSVVNLQERENPYVVSFAKSRDSEITRIEQFVKIFEDGFDVLILTAQNLFEKYTDLKLDCILLTEGLDIQLETLIGKLLTFGYERVKTVEKKGQFSQKGGIVDIYPVASTYPVRIEFFGDTIDTIRLFDVETQKSFEKKDSIKIYKAIEWDLQEDFSEGLKHIKDDYKKTKSKLKEESRKNLEETFKEVIEGIRLDVERLYPYYYQLIFISY